MPLILHLSLSCLDGGQADHHRRMLLGGGQFGDHTWHDAHIVTAYLSLVILGIFIVEKLVPFGLGCGWGPTRHAFGPQGVGADIMRGGGSAGRL